MVVLTFECFYVFLVEVESILLIHVYPNGFPSMIHWQAMANLWFYEGSCHRLSMPLGTGNCPKCGSSDWKLPRHVRARGVTSVATADLNIITCKNCGFTELYELTKEELAPVNKKARMIFIFAGVLPTLLGIAIPIWLIWG